VISSITIKGFKSIIDQTISLGRLNVLIGANGSGKTALLEAIGVLGCAVEGRVDDVALLRRGVRPGVPDLYKSAFRDVRVRRRLITLSAKTDDKNPASYLITLDKPTDEATAPWRINHEAKMLGKRKQITRGPRGANIWGPKNRKVSIKTDPTRSLAHVTSPFGPEPRELDELLSWLQGFAIFDPQTPVLRGTENDMLQRDPLGLHGGRLAETVQQLLHNGFFGVMKKEDLLEILDWVEAIGVATPTRELISPSIPAAQRVLRFTDKYMRRAQNELSGYDASEGSLYVLFALALVFHPRSPGFFALENIDHALHPLLARKLVENLCVFVRGADRQVLVTTHNPLVLDGLRLADDAIRLFTVSRSFGGHTEVRRVEYSDALAKAEAKNMTLSQMWTTGVLGAVPNLA